MKWLDVWLVGVLTAMRSLLRSRRHNRGVVTEQQRKIMRDYWLSKKVR